MPMPEKVIVSISKIYLKNDEESGIIEHNFTPVHLSAYEIKTSVETFAKKLEYFIMQHKKDGITIDVDSTPNYNYIDVRLRLGESEQNYDSQYIINYITQNFKKIDIPMSEYKTEQLEELIYIYTMDELPEAFCKSLSQEGINIKKINTFSRVYHHGASSFITGFILAISARLTGDTIKAIFDKSVKKFSHMNSVTLNFDKLKKNLSSYTNFNSSSFEIIQLNKDDTDNTYSVVLRNPYKMYSIVCDIDGNIKKLDCHEFVKNTINS